MNGNGNSAREWPLSGGEKKKPGGCRRQAVPLLLMLGLIGLAIGAVARHAAKGGN